MAPFASGTPVTSGSITRLRRIRRTWRILSIIATGVALGLALTVGILWSQLERRYIFFPTAELQFTPADTGLQYEDVSFHTRGGRQLQGWYIPGTVDTGNTTWIWFHGNGGNISHRVDELAMLHHRLGVNIFIFDYQGYGRSQGEPTEQGTYQDARAALDHVSNRPGIDPSKIVYFGKSLGAAVAVELATEKLPAGLILVSPFSSVSDMARRAFPYLPVGWLLKDRYDSASRIRQIQTPLLIIHGAQDEMVPVDQGRALFEAANDPKIFRLLPGAGHNDTHINGGPGYWDTLEEFSASITAGRQGTAD